MASASPFKDIDDKFCLCSICLEQLKEPKLLPCLHRFCKDCLNTLLRASKDVFGCPECREEIQVPPNGVNGFKTDFYSKSLVEHVQIQRSLKSDEMRECYGCSKHLSVTAYCFKCNDFLCKDCHSFHVTNKLLKDHQKHTLTLEDIESKNITIEKLASMRDAPRCHTHPEKICELHCETCDNLPVCMACTFGDHKGHDLHEVKTLAKSKRQTLAQKLTILEVLERENKITPPGKAKEMLNSNVTKAKENLLKLYEDKAQYTKAVIRDVEKRQEQIKQEKQNTETFIFDSLQREMEKEIQEVKKRYEQITNTKRIEISDAFKGRQTFLERELDKLHEELDRFNKDKKELLESIQMQLNTTLQKIDAVSEHFDNTNKRFFSCKVLASTIIASENDWTAVQCIPEICAAADNLIKDLEKQYGQLDTLVDVTVNYEQSSLEPIIPEKLDQLESKITINKTDLYVNGVTSCGNGNIFISASLMNSRRAFIVVMDTNGNILKQKKLNAEILGPSHFCDFLTQTKVATVYQPNTIGVYNVLDDSYIQRNISDVINSWPSYRYVACIAADPVNNHILVGGSRNRDVYVFDDQLNYLHILTLPEMIKWPRDITVSNGHLLVCDYDGQRSFVTTIDGLKIKVFSEFLKPDLEGDGWKPSNVCTDKNGLVYMLWRCGFFGQCYLMQYTHDGRQHTSKQKVDKDAYAVAAIDTSQGQKLVVATYITQKVYIYG